MSDIAFERLAGVLLSRVCLGVRVDVCKCDDPASTACTPPLDMPTGCLRRGIVSGVLVTSGTPQPAVLEITSTSDDSAPCDLSLIKQ